MIARFPGIVQGVAVQIRTNALPSKLRFSCTVVTAPRTGNFTQTVSLS